MRTHFRSMLSMAAIVLVAAALTFSERAMAADSAAGKYTGTWEGAGSAGRFELILETGSDGKLTGGVSVGSDTGDYTAKFAMFTLVGNKLSAKYEYPPEPMAEVVLEATLESGKATGTWVMQPKGGGGESLNGTWSVKK